MAKISNQSEYPQTSPAAEDYLIGTDASDDKATKTYSFNSVASWINDQYVLPVATSLVLGGVKIGSGITVGVDGTISTDNTTINTLSGDLTLAQGTGISITDNGTDIITVANTFTDSPLELIDEGNGDGIVLAGRTAINYGNVGNKAVDLSHSNQTSTTYGATAEYSFAAGYLATASGLYSVSFSGTATGNNSLSLGRQSQATASSAVALGSSSLATGISDLAIGQSATASGGGSISIGTLADSTAFNSIAIGGQATASSQKSIAIGDQATASANNAVALGSNASASAVNAFSVGNNSEASGTASMAIGNQATTTHSQSVAIGQSSQTTSSQQIALGSIDSTVSILIASLPNTPSYADDVAAAAGGVLVGELYRTGSIVKVRVS